MRLSLLAALIALAPAAHADQITIFAAASLKTAMDQIAADWQAAHGDTLVISYAGSTGKSTGPHVHYEIRKNDTAIDPWTYLIVYKSTRKS